MNPLLERLTYRRKLKMLARILGLRRILRDPYFRWTRTVDVSPQAIVDFLRSMGFASLDARPRSDTFHLLARKTASCHPTN